MARGITYGWKCYMLLYFSDTVMVLSRTTIQHLTAEKPIDPDVQERIRDYHGSLEDVIGSEDFVNSLDGYESLINDNEEGISKGDTNKEGYQVPPDPPDTQEIKDNSDKEMSANSYDQYIGAEVVLPDRKGEKIMGKVRKRVRYDDTGEKKGNYNATHNKSLYEVEYNDGTTEELADNIIAENML